MPREFATELREREREVAESMAAIAEARDGHGQMLVLQAPAGLGKTSLLAAASRSARESDMRVLAARGSELEFSFPFGVVRQLFEAVLYGAPDDVRSRLLSGAAELAATMFDASAALDELDAADATYARLHGLYWLTNNIARERPLLICCDDAHWADDPSLKFLSFSAAASRICLCCCWWGRVRTRSR